MDDSLQLVAKSGIAYYISPPHTFKEVVLDLIHSAVYVTFMLSACAPFTKTWIEFSGSGPRGVAKQLKGQQMVCLYLTLLFRCDLSYCVVVYDAHLELPFNFSSFRSPHS